MIVQASRVFHTVAKPMERLLSRPQFDGPVTAGMGYVLDDDVTCLGGTLAELPDHMQASGAPGLERTHERQIPHRH